MIQKMSFFFFLIPIQTGGYTTANYIWDLLQARKITPSFPAVEAYYKGLKVILLPSTLILLLWYLLSILRIDIW